MTSQADGPPRAALAATAHDATVSGSVALAGAPELKSSEVLVALGRVATGLAEEAVPAALSAAVNVSPAPAVGLDVDTSEGEGTPRGGGSGIDSLRRPVGTALSRGYWLDGEVGTGGPTALLR